MSKPVVFHNFWNDLRESQKLTLNDLEAITSIPHSSLGKWFSGFTKPKDNSIRILCDIFNVDFEEGKREFLKAYSERHTSNISETDNKLETPIEDNQPHHWLGSDLDKVSNKKAEEKPQRNLDSVVMRKLYGKVPYDIFFNFISYVANGSGDPLEEIYGKVSYEEYECIRSIIIDGEYPDDETVVRMYEDEYPEFDKWGNVIGMKKR